MNARTRFHQPLTPVARANPAIARAHAEWDAAVRAGKDKAADRAWRRLVDLYAAYNAGQQQGGKG